ncbi:MAG: HEPN domain-containing protein [Phycisphaerales bacterium]|nr:HEPN domain-containing protein [Phycisphaerales bacterium]
MSEVDQVTEARKWLRYGREDLAAAAALQDSGVGVPRQVCWLAQQAAEKTLKGTLAYLQIDFPRTHDLELLRNILPEPSRSRLESLDTSELSEWAVEGRYPGDWPEATESDARHAVALAQQILDALSGELSRLGFSPS